MDMRHQGRVLLECTEVVAMGAAVFLAACGAQAEEAPTAEDRDPQTAVSAPTVPRPAPSAQVRRTGGSSPLAGTLVREGGRSLALFAVDDAFWTVREGEELADGGVLREVQTDRIVVERGGVRQEILLFPGGVAQAASRKPTTGLAPRPVVASAGETADPAGERLQALSMRATEVRAQQQEERRMRERIGRVRQQLAVPAQGKD